MVNIQELKRRRLAITRQIAAERKKKKMIPLKRGRERNPVRRRYPGFSSMMDRAAGQMWR